MQAKRLTLAVLLALFASSPIYGGSGLPNPVTTADPSGNLSTYSTGGPIDVSNPFFQNLGTNGRTCNSCHVSSTGWTISPAEVQTRFKKTGGTDPIFRTNDGANCPSADVSSVTARQAAYSQLLNKGLIRISIPVPSGADFQITQVSDPYNCPQTTAHIPAMYRRPLPSTNLAFLTTVMWDGRETFRGQSITADLAQQSSDATMGHAEAATPPTTAQQQQIVAFETALYTAQMNDNLAGGLTAKGAGGGPINLSQQQFYPGINDALGGDPTGAQFNQVAMTVYEKWLNSSSPARASIARGEDLFNNLPITIEGVAGLNDLPGMSSFVGSCTTCHDSPNVGNHSVALAINIGVADYPARPGLDISGLPVYTIQCNAGGPPVQTTDPGKALISGKCADVGKLKGPILRGLAARAPYFHNGSAKTLRDAVDFYDSRFHLALTEQQKQDLVAFLQTL
jgi:hypothetical protein